MISYPSHIHRIPYSGATLPTRSAWGKNRLTKANVWAAFIAAIPFMILHMAVGKAKNAALVVVVGRHIPPGARSFAPPRNATIVYCIRVFTA